MSRFLYGAGDLAPDAMERAGSTYLLLKDERGSVRFVVDSTTGAVAQSLEYDAFGRVLSDSAPGFQPFGFARGIRTKPYRRSSTRTSRASTAARSDRPWVGARRLARRRARRSRALDEHPKSCGSR